MIKTTNIINVVFPWLFTINLKVVQKDKPRAKFYHINTSLKTWKKRDSEHRTWEEANSWVLYSFLLLVYNFLDFIFKCMSWPRKAREHRLPAVSDSPFLFSGATENRARIRVVLKPSDFVQAIYTRFPKDTRLLQYKS